MMVSGSENNLKGCGINTMKFSIKPEAKELGINVCMATIRDTNIVNKNTSLEKIKKENIKKLQTIEIPNNKILEDCQT